MKTYAKIWAWLAVLLPAAFGLVFIFNSELMLSQNTAAGVAYMVGVRSVVFAILLLIALLRFSPSVVALLLVGRGLTDLGDSLTGLAVTHALGFSVLAPLAPALISFVVAYLIFKEQKGSR